MNLLLYLLACVIVNSLMRRRLIIVLEKTFLKLKNVFILIKYLQVINYISSWVYDLVVSNDSSVLFCIILRTCHAFVRIFPLFEQKLLQCSLLAVASFAYRWPASFYHKRSRLQDWASELLKRWSRFEMCLEINKTIVRVYQH